ncbi:MAG: UDP-N-acetylmuramate--L-alanine ligase [Chloroflexota bacterium]|nr:UDP-N-acetylmuramate--L-alanine ligase [Chloroflexota bacterium]
MLQLEPGQRIHFIGIGGAGLSAIARILLERGYAVSGSDLRGGSLNAALARDGARVYVGHDGRYVEGADIVLATSAAQPDHVEIAAAKALDIPVFKRKDFMPAILHRSDTIAIAGAHGKTTTTSMVIHILQTAGKDPSFIVGGTMANTGRNAGLGTGPSFVIEADEYDNMFHGLNPNLAVVTNVEHDHPDFFTTREQMRAAFDAFVASLADDGALVACADDETARAIAEGRRAIGGKVIGYGIENPAADWRATDLSFSDDIVKASVLQRGCARAELQLKIPGAHNVLNALAALAVADERGVSPDQGAAALNSFQSTGRRFEIRGERDGVLVVDDYAHHPTEIRVNIEAARLRYPERQIWAVWQPHTYSRIQTFWSDFVSAFDGADQVMVTPIYAAREAPLEGVTGAALAKAISSRRPATYSPTFDDVAETLSRAPRAPAVVLIFSAGDANLIADKFLAAGT